jgi:hypothetical protein
VNLLNRKGSVSIERLSTTRLNNLTTISKELDGAFVVWFAAGNQFLRMEEPAYFVFRDSENGFDREQIACRCVEKYGISAEQSRVFTTDVLTGIEKIRNWKSPVIPEDSKGEALRQKRFSPFSVRNYSLNGKTVSFHFETLEYEYFIHPLFRHLELDALVPESALFELFGYGKRIVLRVSGQVKGTWRSNESHLVKGMVFLQLLNVVYGKTDRDWMAVIHASAVSNGEKTIVFTASSGSGKSTIAALLKQKGFSVLADDFVPVEGATKQVCPLPAAISVKEGAIGLLSAWYPELQANLQTYQTERYLPFEGCASPAPVRAIVFIKYNRSVDFEWQELPRPEALKMLLEETWTSPSAENASRFLDWYSEIPCYRLTYSNNEKALQIITKLFEQ